LTHRVGSKKNLCNSYFLKIGWVFGRLAEQIVLQRIGAQPDFLSMAFGEGKHAESINDTGFEMILGGKMYRANPDDWGGDIEGFNAQPYFLNMIFEKGLKNVPWWEGF
jgi:hypothetical protein